MEPVSHTELRELAEKVSHVYYDKLGLCLGLTQAKLDNIKKDNRRSEDAMYEVLCQWLNHTLESESRQKLKEAFSQSGLLNLAEDVARGNIGPKTSARTDATEELIDHCRKDLMDEYALKFCQVQTKPLDPETLLELESIYTNLNLMGKDSQAKTPQPLEYSKLLDNKINGVWLHRVLIQGEAGVGKTTLMCKIINDWIQGKEFTQFKLVVPIMLREVENGKTVGEVLKSYLPDDNNVTAEQLNEYIKTHQEKVLILLDGYDEIGDDASAEQHFDHFLKIIKCVKLKKCFVIVTSRPWRMNGIRGNIDLHKRYAFVEVKGFTRDNVKEFVFRFFGDDKESAKSLVKFMEKGSLIAENMSPYPIFCAMLCHLWKEEARREVVQRLQTFSQLFQEIMAFMEDSYFQKLCTNLRSRSSNKEDKMAIEKSLLELAKVAFEGLLQNNLVFTEDIFSKDALKIGYNLGILTKDKKRAGRSERKKTRMIGKVCFPHKLFQEYLAGLHLAETAGRDAGNYKRLLSKVLDRDSHEMKFLLYFAGAEKKEVALDITSGLIEKLERTSVRSTRGVEEAAHKLIADVAFESFNEEVAREVEKRFRSLSRMTELEVDDSMSAHTVAGYFFVFKKLESVVFLERLFGHTLSGDLASKICTLPSLRKVELKRASFRDVFYEDFSKEAAESQVTSFTLSGMRIESEVSSSCLAEGLCAMPNLAKLNMYNASLDAKFYSTMAWIALHSQIREFHLADMALEHECRISTDLAKAICSMPQLRTLFLSDWIVLHADFYKKLASHASAMQIENIILSDLELKNALNSSCDLARCLNTMPCLKKLVIIKKTEFHPVFFSKFSELSQKIHGDENQTPASKTGFSLTLDDKTAIHWAKHGLHTIVPRLQTLILRCGRSVETNLLKKMSLPGLQGLEIQAGLPTRDPGVLNVDEFCNTLLSSFVGLQRLVLTHVALGNQKAEVIIEEMKKHHHIKSIGFIQCHTDDKMDDMAKRIEAESHISITRKHGERQKM